jgi:regulator of extracellular matrix RemA (YlzA/DUF370 family)
MISIGYRNYVATHRIISVISPVSRPIKNLINGAREAGRLIDATMGKKTKCVVITDSNHLILSANSPDTIVHRIQVASKKSIQPEEDH